MRNWTIGSFPFLLAWIYWWTCIYFVNYKTIKGCFKNNVLAVDLRLVLMLIRFKKKTPPHIVRYAITLTSHIKRVNLYSVFLMVSNKTRSFWQNAKRRTCFTFKFLHHWEWKLVHCLWEQTLSSLFPVYVHESLNFLPQHMSSCPSGSHPRLVQTKRCNEAQKKNYVTYHVNSNRWTEK